MTLGGQSTRGMKRGERIPSLDGLRALSIAVVYAGHAKPGAIPGGFGVTVFFVVSGYLITTLLRLEWDRTGTVSIRDFYIRRAFRILPLFYAVLTLFLFATIFLGLGIGVPDFGATLSQYTHIANYWSILRPDDLVMPGTGVYWSLAVEEHFYLVFPAVFVLLTRLAVPYRRQAVWLGALCGAILAWRCFLVLGLDVGVDRTYHATDTRIDSILIGCALALGLNPMLDRRVDSRIVNRSVVVALVGLGLSIVYRQAEYRETLRYSIQSLAVVPVLYYSTTSPDSFAGRVLNSKIMVWFGQLSYAFYLIHFVILVEFSKHLGTIPAAIAAFVVSTLGSVLLKHTVEMPGLRLRSKFIGRRGRSTQPANV